MGKDFFDAVIVGGGHNGLVCSYYLAKAGLKVKILERRNIVGGAAVTEEFHPGFKNSTASYTVSLLNPDVIKDMYLKENGLEIVKRPPSSSMDYHVDSITGDVLSGIVYLNDNYFGGSTGFESFQVYCYQ